MIHRSGTPASEALRLENQVGNLVNAARSLSPEEVSHPHGLVQGTARSSFASTSKTVLDVPSLIAGMATPSLPSPIVPGPTGMRYVVVFAGALLLGLRKTSGIRSASGLLCSLSQGSSR